MQRSGRIKRELQMMSESPSEDISCWSNNSSIADLLAEILGTEDTPYENGCFKLELQIPERYPFEPPKVKFLTPIYHPNIDNAGRICLDILKMPPQGSWKPSININTLLTSIKLLMNDPNPDDPLMVDISDVFKSNRPKFLETARLWTKKYACNNNCPSSSCGTPSVSSPSTDVTTSEDSDGSDDEVQPSTTGVENPPAIELSDSEDDFIPTRPPAKKRKSDQDDLVSIRPPTKKRKNNQKDNLRHKQPKIRTQK